MPGIFALTQTLHRGCIGARGASKGLDRGWVVVEALDALKLFLEGNDAVKF
jgi:hypothetical protein